MNKSVSLYTAQELERLLGERYFYRQGIYRLAEDGSIITYQIDGVSHFSSDEVRRIFLQKLAEKIRSRYPRQSLSFLRIKFEPEKKKEIAIYNYPDKLIASVNTESETEEVLLNKFDKVREEVISVQDIPVMPPNPMAPPPPPPPAPGGPPPPPPHGGPAEEHHRFVMDALKRIEETLKRIEEKLG